MGAKIADESARIYRCLKVTNIAESYDVKRSGKAMKPFSQFSLDINLLFLSARVAILIFVVALCVAKKMSQKRTFQKRQIW